MTSPSLGNSNHVFFSDLFFFFDFLFNSKQQVPFHGIACGYYGADLGSPYHHLRDVPGRYLYRVIPFKSRPVNPPTPSDFFEIYTIGIYH